MADTSSQVQLEQLRASWQVLEAQRALLGEAIEPAFQAVRAQIAALEAEIMPPTSTEERRIVTILFSDIVGSTTLAENMDAEPVRSNRVPLDNEVTNIKVLGLHSLSTFLSERMSLLSEHQCRRSTRAFTIRSKRSVSRRAATAPHRSRTWPDKRTAP